MEIVSHKNVRNFFENAIKDTIYRLNANPSEIATCYIIHLLSDNVTIEKNPLYKDILNEPLTFLMQEISFEKEHSKRFIKFCNLGDGILYILGFFGKKNVLCKVTSHQYISEIGSNAYKNAAGIIKDNNNLFCELSEKYCEFIDIIQYMSNNLKYKEKINYFNNKNILKI